MEKDSLRGHFEQLLNERTGEFKMYPTERVWNSIYRRLHTRRKWHFIGGGTFALMILAGVFVLMQDNPRPPSKTFSHTIGVIKPGARMLVTENKSGLHTLPAKSNELNFNAGELQFNSSPLQSATSGEDIAAVNPGRVGIFEMPAPDGATLIEAHAPGMTLQKAQNDPLLTSRLESIRDAKAALSTSPMRVISSPGRYSWDIHFEPSVSYRTLKSKTTITSASLGFIVVDNNGHDINQLVNQRPSVGFEVGSDVRYALTSRWNLKAGLQFNYSRYTAEALVVQPHTAVTTLQVGSSSPTQFSSVTQYANAHGQPATNSATWIPDQRVELSLPLGAEYEILRNGSFSWNVAGSFQPSYILNAKAFLLSTDHMSYVQNPNLLRTWNMNVGAETFLRFNRGDIQIQVGPQFRYQLLPSFISSYPVSEHLYDIGFKIGIVRTIR